MLVRAEIANYKSIASLALDFSYETVIVGPNGAGKSNLLDAPNFIRDAAVDGLDHAVTTRHGINSIRRWSKTKPYHVSLKAYFRSGESWGEFRFTLASLSGEFQVVEEEARWHGISPIFLDGNNQQRNTYYYKRDAQGILEISTPDSPFGEIGRVPLSESELLMSQFGPGSVSALSFFFQPLFNEISSAGAYLIYPNKIREPQTISNAQVLADDGTNLASIIRRMRATGQRANREALTAAIKQVLPIVNEIRIESAGGFYVPVFRVRETADSASHELNMSQISDGTLRMLGMLTAFYQPSAPARITVEEPEQMIHPGLLPVFVEASGDFLDDKKKSRQCFFTTHSPNLLDLFDPSNIIAGSYEDGVSRFSPMSARQRQIVDDRLFSAGQLLVAEGVIA